MDKLDKLRKEIDNLDEQLLELLHKRIVHMGKIGEVKKELHMPIRDEERENKKITDVQKRAEEFSIPESLVRQVWKLFFEISEQVEK